MTSRRPFLLPVFREDLFLYNWSLEERAALGLPLRGADRRIVGQELVRVVVVIAIVRADGKSQVRQCLGFSTAYFGSSLAYESAE